MLAAHVVAGMLAIGLNRIGPLWPAGQWPVSSCGYCNGLILSNLFIVSANGQSFSNGS